MAQFKFKIIEQDINGCIGKFSLFLGDDERAMKVHAEKSVGTGLEWWCDIQNISLCFDIHDSWEKMCFYRGVRNVFVVEFFVEKFFNADVDKEHAAQRIAFLKNFLAEIPLRTLDGVDVIF